MAQLRLLLLLVGAGGALAVTNTTPPSPLFKQCDKRWGSERIHVKTVCAVGCLMSSTSMAMSMRSISIGGAPANPGTLNTWLVKSGGYVNGTDDMEESAVARIAPSRIAWTNSSMHRTNDLSFAAVAKLLGAGDPIIANVDHGGHFVLVVGFSPTDGDTLYVNDPGFHRVNYSHTNDVVGWRLFQMSRKPARSARRALASSSGDHRQRLRSNAEHMSTAWPNWKAALVTAAVSLFVEQSVTAAWRAGWVRSDVARKFMHVAMGPVYCMCWPLFDEHGSYWAATVPLAISAKFYLIGTTKLNDRNAPFLLCEDTIRSMSRHVDRHGNGDPSELLQGPLQYGLVFIVATLLMWQREVGLAVLAVLCVGDAAAEIFGHRYGGGATLPWSSTKTYAGSLAMSLFSALAIAVGAEFARACEWPTASPLSAGRIAAVAVLAALVESVSPPDTDNLTVPLATYIAIALV